MKRSRQLLIGIIALVIGAAGLMAALMAAIEPTQGNTIERYANPQKALLIIDVQEDYTGMTATPPFPYKDSGRMIGRINQLIGRARKDDVRVVYIKQEFDVFWGRMFSRMLAQGTAIKGNPGTEIDRRLSIISGNVFSKPKPDAFSNPDLERFLISHRVDELYIVGLDAEYCVHATAQGALNRGYRVNIVVDGVLLRAEHKWNDLLNQYREEGIVLKSSRDFGTGPS